MYTICVQCSPPPFTRGNKPKRCILKSVSNRHMQAIIFIVIIVIISQFVCVLENKTIMLKTCKGLHASLILPAKGKICY